ncbi:otu family cysteine protease [Cystoisospora suis]|uniref:Otu family cysteine protease n=1 Tax=Cystoisospora suis TaxID=483139 RepID=A0A2C6KY39_9APIC|nr:otu family cysteine protease [Cystoisospora suis]
MASVARNYLPDNGGNGAGKERANHRTTTIDPTAFESTSQERGETDTSEGDLWTSRVFANTGLRRRRPSRTDLRTYITRGRDFHHVRKKSIGGTGRSSRTAYIAFFTAVLTAVLIVLSRQTTDRIEARIRTENLRFLSNHNCPAPHTDDDDGHDPQSSEGQGFPSKERRLAGGEDASVDAEVACTVADALSRVSGGRTVALQVPGSDVREKFFKVNGCSLDDIFADISKAAGVSLGETPEYISSLLELNPAASVSEIRDLVLYFEGDAKKIAEVLKKAKTTSSLKQREIERCGHRDLGFRPLSSEEQRQMADRLGIRHISSSPFMVSSPQLGDPVGIIDVKGDGNCFYRAISYITSGSEDHWIAVRVALGNWMEQNLGEGAPFASLVSTDELRRQETEERKRDSSEYAADVPHCFKSPDLMSRRQLLKARCFRVKHPSLGAYATDLEMDAMANLLRARVATFLQGSIDAFSGRKHLDIWEVRNPLSKSAKAEEDELPVVYLRLNRFDHFQPVTQVSSPFHRLILNSHFDAFYKEGLESTFL